MSTEVTLLDEQEITSAIADVRSDATETNWVLCGHHDDNPNVIQLVGAGEGGVEEMVGHLDEFQYMYGLVRQIQVIDMSQTTKFVYIKWVGKSMQFVKKGKYGVVSGSIEKNFNPYQVVLDLDGETSDPVDITELITNKLEESSGTKNKVLDASEAKDRPERGFTAGASSSGGQTGAGNIGGGIGKQGNTFSGVSLSNSDMTIIVEDDVLSEIAAVRSDEDESKTWVCAKFQDNNVKKKKPVLVKFQSGNDNSEMPSSVESDEVACILLRVNDTVDDIQTVKFVYILWVGEQVKPMAKGKISTLKGDLDSVFLPSHVYIHATIPNDIRLGVIQDKVGSASGSKSNIK